jgi:hypothetical protein
VSGSQNCREKALEVLMEGGCPSFNPSTLWAEPHTPYSQPGAGAPSYLSAHLSKLLQKEVLALQELPHHGLSTGKVPILAVKGKGGSCGQCNGKQAVLANPIL